MVISKVCRLWTLHTWTSQISQSPWLMHQPPLLRLGMYHHHNDGNEIKIFSSQPSGRDRRSSSHVRVCRHRHKTNKAFLQLRIVSQIVDEYISDLDKPITFLMYVSETLLRERIAEIERLFPILATRHETYNETLYQAERLLSILSSHCDSVNLVL